MATNISSCNLNGKIILHNLSGDTFYYQDGNFHREDGPAIEMLHRREYYINGIRHRLDGPAIETNNDEDKWYYYGELIPVNSQQDFERYLQLYILI